MAGAAPPLRFPAVTHVLRASGHDDVVLRAEVHVARAENQPAVTDVGEIDRPARTDQARPVHDRIAEHAQARDAAVGKDVEPNVAPRPGLGFVYREIVVRIAGERHLREDRRPRLTFDTCQPPGHRARLVDSVDGTMRGVIAREETRIDLDAADAAADPKLEDAPVVPGTAPAPRLPAVHPFPARGEAAGDEDRRLRLHEIR